MDTGVEQVSDDDFTYSSERFRPGFLYIVSWPAHDGLVVKAGVTDYPARWRKFLARGATLHALWRGPDYVRLETAIHRRMDARYRCAFARKEDAQAFTGSLGGWMECYAVPEADLPLLLEEVARDLVQGG